MTLLTKHSQIQDLIHNHAHDQIIKSRIEVWHGQTLNTKHGQKQDNSKLLKTKEKQWCFSSVRLYFFNWIMRSQWSFTLILLRPPTHLIPLISSQYLYWQHFLSFPARWSIVRSMWFPSNISRLSLPACCWILLFAQGLYFNSGSFGWRDDLRCNSGFSLLQSGSRLYLGEPSRWFMPAL